MKTSQWQEKPSFFRQSTILCLIVAFAGVKGLQYGLSADILRHLSVAVLLLVLPAVFGSSYLRLCFRDAMSFRLRRDDAVVLAYFLLPLVVNLLFLPESWPQTKSHWQDWVLSELGLLSILAAPMAEEYFFRGWLLKRQWEALETKPPESSWAKFKICYVNALVFWLMHMPVDLNLWKQALLVGAVPSSPGPFLLGLVTCLLTLRTGNVRAALLFHAVANASGPLWWPLLASDNLRSLFYN